MSEFENISMEIVRFIRGNYHLNEVAGMYHDVPCLKFRQGKKTIATILLQEGYYDFIIIFGTKEREEFEASKHLFSTEIQQLYDNQRTLHNGKWLLIHVDNLQTLEAVKKMILIKKKPNRKALSRENAVFGKCGHRCDMCIHYTSISDYFRNSLIPHLNSVYGYSDWSMRCTGCDTEGCHCHAKGNELCEPIKCLRKKLLNSCLECKDYPCEYATVGYRQLEHKTISADDVTWAILPYVPHQYE